MTKPKENYDHCWNWKGSPWRTKYSWMTYLRSALRKAWMKHPVKLEKLKQGRMKIPNPNPKSATRFPEVYGAQCECCLGIFPLSAGKKEAKNKDYIVVDHKEPAGEFKDPKDFQKFFTGLLCISLDDLRLLCTSCNALYLYAQQEKCTIEEAKYHKEAIQIVKDKMEKQWLLERNILPASAQANRRQQVFEQLKKERGII